MDDAAQLAGEVDSEMRYGLQLAEDAQLLSGDGTGDNLTGMLMAATAYSAPTGITVASPTHIDKLGLAIVKLALAEFQPDGIILNPEGEVPGDNEIHVYLAIWSDITDRPEGWALSTAPAWFGEAYQPYTWAPVDQLQTPPPAVPADRERFRPIRDGRRLLEEQRRNATSGQSVGGFGEVATVTRSGVTLTRLCEWPDRVGERIAI